MTPPGSPTFFATPAAFRAWLEEHHATATEVIAGFYKKGSRRASITWPEAVDEALRFGWIDSVRRGLDETSYTNRFTPRRPSSNWSNVNIRRVAELEDEGRMTPAGLAAFARRKPERSGVYSAEQPEDISLPPDCETALRAETAAWDWFHAQPRTYRRAVIWWLISAKQDATRRRRLQTLIECSAAGRTAPPFTRRPGASAR